MDDDRQPRNDESPGRPDEPRGRGLSPGMATGIATGIAIGAGIGEMYERQRRDE